MRYPRVDMEELTAIVALAETSDMAKAGELLHIGPGAVIKSAAYVKVVLVYIGTETVEINLARIINRVLVGGHDVPESDVRRRYQRSLKNAPIAISRADHVILFDNSTEQGYQLVGVIDQGQNEWLEPLPKWAIGLQHHLPSEHSA